MISGLVFRSMAKKSILVQYPYSHYAERYPREECRFSCHRCSLCGYFYGNENRESPALILVAPGAGCPADGHLSEITYFVDHGWQVFSYDATSLGKSEGKSVRGLPQAGRDLAAALACVAEEKDLPIVIYAHSAGAYAACRNLSKAPVLAAACIAGFDLPTEIMFYHAKLHVGALSILGYPALALRDFFAFGREGNRSAVKSINAVETPVLLYQDKADLVVPFEASLAGRKDRITNQNVRVAELSSGHSGAWLTERAGAYVRSVEKEYITLQKQYGGRLPEPVKESFLTSIDYERASEPNAAFLDGVLEFFRQETAKKALQ